MGSLELQPAARAKSLAPTQTDADNIVACWNEIGVYGDHSCKELETHLHCRNCPVYSAAGARLLDRQVPADYRREWTEHFAQEKKLAPTGKISALFFRIQSEWLALPAQMFQEVARRRPIHSLPHRRQGIVLGLVNIRGELLICVSLGRLLGIEQIARRLAQGKVYDRLLVAEWERSRFAFPADEVHGIRRLDPEQLKEPPATISVSGLAFSQGVFLWQDRTVGLLDAGVLFSTLNRSLA